MTPAHADSIAYTFANVTNNSSDISAQFKLTVSDDGVGSGQIGLLFENLAGGAASSIANIYFEDDSVLASFSSFSQGPGVEFDDELGSPGHPPGISGFTTSTALCVSADNPKPHRGINPGEWLRVIFNLQSGMDFSGVVAALDNGFLKSLGDAGFDDDAPSLRSAFHVIALPMMRAIRSCLRVRSTSRCPHHWVWRRSDWQGSR